MKWIERTNDNRPKQHHGDPSRAYGLWLLNAIGDVVWGHWNSILAQHECVAFFPANHHSEDRPTPWAPPGKPRPPGWYSTKDNPPTEVDSSATGHIQAAYEDGSIVIHQREYVIANPESFPYWHPMNTQPAPTSGG